MSKTTSAQDDRVLTGRNILAIHNLCKDSYREWFNPTYLGTFDTNEPGHALIKLDGHFLLVISDYVFNVGEPFPKFRAVEQVNIAEVEKFAPTRQYGLAELPVKPYVGKMPGKYSAPLELANGLIPSLFPQELTGTSTSLCPGAGLNIELYAKLHKVLKPLGAFYSNGCTKRPSVRLVSNGNALCSYGELSSGARYFVTVAL